jgi:hypothetical protein
LQIRSVQDPRHQLFMQGWLREATPPCESLGQ